MASFSEPCSLFFISWKASLNLDFVGFLNVSNGSVYSFCITSLRDLYFLLFFNFSSRSATLYGNTTFLFESEIIKVLLSFISSSDV